MKIIILNIVLISFCGYLNAQKMYIYCPNEFTTSPQEQVLNDTEINLVIKDRRIFSAKTKHKCSSEELVASLYNFISSTYSNAIFHKLDESKSELIEGSVYIEIDIQSYYAVFTSPKWNNTTAYVIRIKDFRSPKVIEVESKIEAETKCWNLSHKTVRNSLSESYLEANIDLLGFITDNLK